MPDDVLAPDETAPLLALLADPIPVVRVAAFSTLTRLPLDPAGRAAVDGYAVGVLNRPADEDGELFGVLDSTPWVRGARTRRALFRLVLGRPTEAGLRGMQALVTADRAEPGGAPPRPAAGFSRPTAQERAAARARTGDEEAVARLRPDTATPADVTAAFELGARGLGHLGARIVEVVGAMGDRFRPDLPGLLAVYRTLVAPLWEERALRADGVEEFLCPDVEVAERWLGWQVAWTVSRGGLDGLVTGVGDALAAPDPTDRLAAACLVADAAGYLDRNRPPLSGGGYGPGRRAPADLWSDELDEIVGRKWHAEQRSWGGEGPSGAGVSTVPSLDEDVRFTVYRPRMMRPLRWYPLLFFAHRTDPIEDPDFGTFDPVEEVRRQAAVLLPPRDGPFDVAAGDSWTPLARGGELTVEPWLHGGEVNPPWATLRWEEDVHRMEFRLRCPASADGIRLAGGVRVFLGFVLIGEIEFVVRVGRDAPVHLPADEPEAVRRYRRIFASYSHRDSDVVARMAEYVEATGDRYLVDTQALRSGEEWSTRLAQMIEEADVFQLFWSGWAMRSPFVRQEWEHALALRRPGFVRPVYWHDPMPADPARGLPPAALRRLHFHQLRTRASTDEYGLSPAPPVPIQQFPALPPQAPPHPATPPQAPPHPAPRRLAPLLVTVVALAVLVVLLVLLLR